MPAAGRPLATCSSGQFSVERASSAEAVVAARLVSSRSKSPVDNLG
jgi:hypothetical protein